MMYNPTRRYHIVLMMMATLLMVTIAPVNAFAGIVGTGSVMADENDAMNRATLIESLGRDDVRTQLESMGVSAEEALERVAAMTDAEVQELMDGLGDVPAGAGVGVVAAVLIVVLVVLLLR